MLLPTGSQMQVIDRQAIDGMGIPSLDLMERAGGGVADVVAVHAKEAGGRVIVVCGRGNNGGDGLVAARLLASRGHDVEVWLAAEPDSFSGDALVNWERLQKEASSAAGEVILKPLGDGNVDAASLAGAWEGSAVIVDALLGTGTSGAPRTPLDAWITAMNIAGPPVVAVDVPSGVNAENGRVDGVAPLASDTVTMAYPKLGLLLHPGRAHTGQIHVVDIGIPPEAAEAADVRTEVLDNPWAAVRLPRRAPDAHKGECGRVVAVAGSAGMMGAGRLVCAAAYRSGAGLVRHAAPASLLAIAHGGRDEVMVTPLEDQASGHFLPLMGDDLASLREALGWADVVALGPGLGLHEETAAFLTQAMESPDEAKPLVLDADGLNLLADNPHLRRVWSGPVVITPHPGEAARLAGQSIEGIQEDRPARAAELARTFDAVTVLKGAPTLIAEPGGRLALCPLGNPGLATGGAGDVLTGMIAGLLAQGMAPFEGASLAVYLHALAGDLAAMDLGIWSLLAGDLIGYLPVAFGHIEAFPDRDVLADGVFG